MDPNAEGEAGAIPNYPRYCINCALELWNNNDGIKVESMLGISVIVGVESASASPNDTATQIKQNISILDALACIFPTSSFINKEAVAENFDFAMCIDCGTALTTLKRAYFQLLNLSKANAKIAQEIRQIELWHSTTANSRNEAIGVDVLNHYIAALREEKNLVARLQRRLNFKSKGISKTKTKNFSNKIKTSKQLEQEPQPDTSSLSIEFLDIKFDTDSFNELNDDNENETFDSVSEDFVEQNFKSQFNMNPNHSQLGKQVLQLKKKKISTTSKQIIALAMPVSNQSKKTEGKDQVGKAIPLIPHPKSAPPFFNTPPQTRLPMTQNDAFEVPSAKLPDKNNKDAWPRYYCNACTKRCLFKWELNLHYLSAHEKKVPKSCFLCKFKYLNPVLYTNHTCIRERTMVEQSLPYRCLYCGQCFENRTAWTQHRKTHEEEYKSKPPPQQENDPIPVWTGRRANSPRFQCSTSGCSEIFMYKWEMEMHVLIVHENTVPDECEKCEFKYFDKKLFEHHSCITKEERNAKELNLRCNYCGNCFKSHQKWTHHRRSHEKEKATIPCTVEGCDKKFLCPKFVEFHIKRSHSDRPKKKYLEKRFPCPECGKVLGRSNLRVHMVQKHSTGLERNLICHLCGMTFQYSSVLENHIKFKHSEVRAYKCPLCNVSFKYKQCLLTHWKGKIHSKEEVAPLLAGQILPNVKPDEVPILPPKRRKRSDFQDESSNSN